MMKIDKRKKYLNFSDIYNCLDYKWNYDFNIHAFAENLKNGKKLTI